MTVTLEPFDKGLRPRVRVCISPRSLPCNPPVCRVDQRLDGWHHCLCIAQISGHDPRCRARGWVECVACRCQCELRAVQHSTRGHLRIECSTDASYGEIRAVVDPKDVMGLAGGFKFWFLYNIGAALGGRQLTYCLSTSISLSTGLI